MQNQSPKQTRNLLKLLFILSIIFTFNLTALGQHQFGIKASGGISRITNSMDISGATLTTPFVSSGQAGLFYSFQLGKKSSLGAELLFSQIEGKEKTETDLKEINEFGESKLVGHSIYIYYSHISYLSLPVYYSFKTNKLAIIAGFQISYALSSNGHDKTIALINGQEETADNKYDDIHIKNFDFGPKAGIIYNLTEKLALEGTYYYGLNNIQKGNPILWQLKVQQATLGLRYTLQSKETAK